MKIKEGFTLIEVLIFIIIMGILGSMLISFYVIMARSSGFVGKQLEVCQLAVQCMEWHLGKKSISGFNGLEDRENEMEKFCSSTSHKLDAKIYPMNIENDPNFRLIIIKVSGYGNSTLSTIVSDY